MTFDQHGNASQSCERLGGFSICSDPFVSNDEVLRPYM